MRQIIPWTAGTLEALLLMRLVARLLAARPDNPFVQWLLTLTDPLRQPLQFLDANQPRFGATFEWSTLALSLIILVVSYALWHATRKGGPPK